MNDNDTIVKLWEIFEPDLPSKAKKNERAYEYLNAILDTGLEVDFTTLKGENEHLDSAIEEIVCNDDDDELDYDE